MSMFETSPQKRASLVRESIHDDQNSDPPVPGAPDAIQTVLLHHFQDEGELVLQTVVAVWYLKGLE